MAAATTYFVVEYDNEASGPFVAEGANLTWSGGTGFIITVVDLGTVGKLHVALISGVKPTNNQVLTQGSTTADTNGPAPNGDSELLLYPAYFREDATVAASGAITWAGPALGTTHSFFWDGQTVNVVVGEILTFVDGQKCEVVTVESDTGTSGEFSVRWISFIDTLGFPDDNDTFTGDLGGNGTLNGVVHPRAYTPLHLHRLLADLNDDAAPAGNDFLSIIDATASDRSTDQIITLLGSVSINDTVSQHMFGGSVSQASGATLYSGLDIQITDSAAGASNPIVIQNDAIVTAYWENAYNPDSIAGRVRLLIKTRSDGVDVDGKRVKAKLLEYGDSYFEGATTLGTATTALALFSSPDGNNTTAVATVAGAPYNTIVITEGYQTIDYNNGNGATPFGLKFDLGSATKAQAYERWKYIQRRGTSENLFGRNAQLVTGVTRNFAYDGESGGPFVEDEIVAWGTEITYQSLAALKVWQVDADAGPGFSDQTTGFNDATDANFTPFPATEATSDYVAIGYSTKFNRVVFDNASGTAVQGVGGVVAWEYWNGTAWAALSGVTDGTSGFTAAKSDGQVLSFTAPSDWASTTLNGTAAFYIRARVTTVYSTNPVYDQGFISGTFTLGEVVNFIGSGARGRLVYVKADAAPALTGRLIFAMDGTTVPLATDTLSAVSSGAASDVNAVTNNSNAGRGLLTALNDAGTTGNLYLQLLIGTSPVDNQLIYGSTSGASCAVNGAVSSRVINNAYVGVFTGSDFQTNLGIALDTTDATAGDRLRNLLDVVQAPPNNQQGTVTGGTAGDRVAVYPWDGSTLDVNGFPEQDFNEMTLDVALVGGSSTTVDVNAIPVNTPASGYLRIQRNSDGEYDLVQYSSWAGSVFTLVGTAPSAASIGNNVFRALIDRVWATTGVPESYTAVQTGSNQVVITLRRGGVAPIKTFKGSATFGATGFTAAVVRTSDA